MPKAKRKVRAGDVFFVPFGSMERSFIIATDEHYQRLFTKERFAADLETNLRAFTGIHYLGNFKDLLAPLEAQIRGADEIDKEEWDLSIDTPPPF